MAKSRAPDWTIEEVEIVLRHPDLSNAEVADLLPEYRNDNSVSWLRGGICAFHKEHENNRVLSKKVRQYLSEKSSPTVCGQCGVTF